MSKRHDLTEELKRLEAEIESYGASVSDAQIWHKKARISAIKQELAELDKPKNDLKNGTAILNERMAQMQQNQSVGGMPAGYDGGRD